MPLNALMVYLYIHILRQSEYLSTEFRVLAMNDFIVTTKAISKNLSVMIKQ